MTDATSPTPPRSGRLTYADYCLLPDDGKRYEIIDGELYVSPAPRPRHQRTSVKIIVALVSALENSGLGLVYHSPIDLVFDKHNVVQPDILFVSRERLDIVGEKYIEEAPDLVIEILSPSTRGKDLLLKFNLYARFGAPFYWIVDPEDQSIEMFQLQGRAYRSLGRTRSPELLQPPQFPGLRLSLSDLFD